MKYPVNACKALMSRVNELPDIYKDEKFAIATGLAMILKYNNVPYKEIVDSLLTKEDLKINKHFIKRQGTRGIIEGMNEAGYIFDQSLLEELSNLSARKAAVLLHSKNYISDTVLTSFHLHIKYGMKRGLVKDPILNYLLETNKISPLK